jgi:ankyrin repeat protein
MNRDVAFKAILSACVAGDANLLVSELSKAGPGVFERLEAEESEHLCLGIKNLVKKRSWDVVELLAASGASLECWDMEGNTPLMMVAENGDCEGARFLIGLGAKVDAQNMMEESALIYAAMRGNVEMAKLLIESGADKELKGAMGDAPLAVAASMGGRRGEEFARALIGWGARVDSRNDFGSTPLMIAAHFADATMVSLLLAAGADVEARDCEGHAALDLARENNSEEALGRLDEEALACEQILAGYADALRLKRELSVSASKSGKPKI